MTDLNKLQMATRRDEQLSVGQQWDNVIRAQFAKPILVDDEAHEPGFPMGDDWAFEFYKEVGGEG